MLRFGEIRPEGWILRELQENMDGVIGHFDELLPRHMNNDIYGAERLGPDSAIPDLGVNDTWDGVNNSSLPQHMWWNSESQSNWRDGFIRSALLLTDPALHEKVQAYLQKVRDRQDPDGYLGIYTPTLRYRETEENGELWAQSSLFRGLIAIYEYGQDPSVLKMIEDAVAVTMKGFPMGASHPFSVKDATAGTGHGLTITDTLDWLYETTGKKEYLDYAVWLYEEFSRAPLNESVEFRIPEVLDPEYCFRGHGVHVYEHFRALAIAAYGKPEYLPVLDAALRKLPFYRTPSGAPVGDEWVYGRAGSASRTGYEFCSLHELMHSYQLLLDKSGDFHFGDLMEWLYYNGAEGMKHPTTTDIMYLKTDDCYTADEKASPDAPRRNPRYKYSPTHQDAALCCVPNMGRILPYFLQSAVTKTETGLGLVLYHPMTVSTACNGQPVSLHAETEYPLDLSVKLTLSRPKDPAFTLTLRFPRWASEMTVNGYSYAPEDAMSGKLTLKNPPSEIMLNFKADIRLFTDHDNAFSVSRGPLVYALPIPSEKKILKTFPVGDFSEKMYTSKNRTLEQAELYPGDIDSFRFDCTGTKGALSWADLSVTLPLYMQGVKAEYTLRPMARTILRKVGFTRFLPEAR